MSLYPLTEAHTSDYLNKVIRKTLEEFDLKPERIISITHDQGSNIKKATSNLSFNPSFCYAHLIQNCIKEAFLGSKKRKIQPNETINEIWYFRKSTKASLLLGKYLIDSAMEDKKLIIDVPTRWDSIYSMLCRFSELKAGIVNCITKILQEKRDKKKEKKRETKVKNYPWSYHLLNGYL